MTRKIRFCAITSLSLSLFWLLPVELSARLEQDPSTIDLTQFINTTPNIFRGLVLDVSDATKPGFSPAIARLKVERWYRGEGRPDESIRYETIRMAGHNCIEFTPGTRWLIFASTGKAYLELADDCYGAVAVSSLLAPVLEHPDVRSQLEADFVAGLTDPDRAGRLLSIQRLGGLRSSSSRPALHKIIEGEDASEKHWATYAALRTGDTTVLDAVREMLVRGDKDVPRFFLAVELSQLKERSAIPGLIDILESVPDVAAREFAIRALGQNLQAVEALPAIAARLEDSEPGVRSYALDAMGLLTREAACTLQTETRSTNNMIEFQVRQCLTWWKDRKRP